MDLDQLHTFLEIVRLKSFSKAAQSCLGGAAFVFSAFIVMPPSCRSRHFLDFQLTRVCLQPAKQWYAVPTYTAWDNDLCELLPTSLLCKLELWAGLGELLLACQQFDSVERSRFWEVRSSMLFLVY